jgi:acetolactate synthase-1/2/3 large subunit
MKVSDFVANFLVSKKIKYVYAVTGGASLHLIHSAKNHKKLNVIFPIHEQTCAMAADAYSRVSHNVGAAFATSGPGATNLATGICGAYFDSVPVMYITGQVSTNRSKGSTGVRQVGFQETDCVDMFKSVTKYSYKILKSNEIKYQLEKAYSIAVSGRKGPVLIDIPDNIQREDINPNKLKTYFKKIIALKKNQKDYKQLLSFISKAKRPILILGWGIHLSNSYKEVLKLIKKLKFPIVTTWAMAHILPHDHDLKVGTWGTHGSRFANFAVQNSDLVLSLGSRLDTKATGSPINTFARDAKKIVIDIDKSELNKFKKFGLKVDLKINQDLKKFCKDFLKIKYQNKFVYNDWYKTINEWKIKYPICLKNYYLERNINPYVFVDYLSDLVKENRYIIVDTGCAIAWTMQGFKFKKNQILLHDFNNTAMGWSIPAAIATAFEKKKQVIVIIGDGSFSFMLQELSLIKKHNLNIKIFLLNNAGQSMIKQTQDQWLKSQYFGSSEKGGLPKIDFKKVVRSFGLNVSEARHQKTLKTDIKDFLNNNKAGMLEVVIPPQHRVIPQVKFGKPNEDSEPLLSRKEFYDNMIIKPIS